MKNMKRIAKTVGALGLVGCAVMSSPIAMADDSGWIVGASVGQSNAKIDDAQISSRLLGAGLQTNSINDDNRDYGYKIFGGYRFNKHFSLEGGYFDLGQFGFTANTTPIGTLSGNIKLKGLNFDAVGTLPLAGKFSMLGRLGLDYAVAKDNFTSTRAVVPPTNPNPNKNALNYKAGLGVQYDFTKALGMRAEAERYRINDAVGSNGDINLYSLGLIYRFGTKKQAPPPPPPRAIAAAPVLVVVPVAQKTEQYCSILDIQFEINEEGIQREEKEKLSVLGTFMTKYPNTTAVIEGHSDNVGTSDHNMQLSMQRAESVVSYLVDGLHIAPSRLTAVGYGETRPIADNSTEEGKRMNRRIDAVVACATDIEGLQVIPARITMAMEMEFDNNKADIKSQYDEGLRKVANFLKSNPAVTATVEGHTSNLQGMETHDMAMAMAQLRAQNVVNYLVDKLGVSRSQLATAAFGDARRFAYNTSVEGQQENRRVNIIFNYSEDSE